MNGSIRKLRNLTAGLGIAGLATVPLGLLLLWSFARGWYWPALLPRSWSLRAWEYVFSSSSGVGTGLVTSLGIALIVTLVAVGMALPAARALAWHDFPGKSGVLLLLLLPVLSPPLAAAMGVHALFVRYGLTDSVAGVVLVHLIPTVPYTTLMLAGSFARFDPDYEAQARTLGASTFAVWRTVTLPFLAPGIAAAAVFAFLISWSQYLLTLLIGGGQVITLPVLLVAFQRSGDESVTAALTLVLVAPTILVFLVASRFLRGFSGQHKNG
ncbi:MAG: ABC transporter permease subunit [Blastocatellia bacterium]|nr:ABC transporter permease subunit [Blastocatellia bacterium]